MKTTRLFMVVVALVGFMFASCGPDEPVKHELTITNDGNGTATADIINAKAGTTITITATANAGYVFKQWTVESGDVALLPDAVTSPATFVMPTGAVRIKAEFSIPGQAYGIETVEIPAGTFQMGSPSTEPNRNYDETQHQVTLTKSFRMSKYEITNTQYAAFLNAKGLTATPGLTSPIWNDGPFSGAICNWGENEGQHLVYDASTSKGIEANWAWGVKWNAATSKWAPTAGYENHPVIWVTWYGAYEYAKWVGGSLPTEAQWEYACRGNKLTLPFSIGTGRKLMADMANFYTRFPYDMDHNPAGEYEDASQASLNKDKTTAVGSYPNANSYGLYDMHGNVLEWCLDRYNEKYDTSATTDPTGPATGGFRLLRGGSWFAGSKGCRSASRTYSLPTTPASTYGFRVVFVL